MRPIAGTRTCSRDHLSSAAMPRPDSVAETRRLESNSQANDKPQVHGRDPSERRPSSPQKRPSVDQLCALHERVEEE